MGRKPTDRQLPPLSELLPQFRGFDSAANRHEEMERLLRGVLHDLRRAERRPFYAVRDVARFFGVSLRTAARVCQRLARQGELLCVRSSMTWIPPRRSRPRVPVRAVIGIPVWLTGFLHLVHWRQFFLCLEEALRQHRFAPDLIFMGYPRDDRASIVQRTLARMPDMVFWFCPTTNDALNTLPLLKDHGVPALVMTDNPGQVPGRYVLSLDRAWRRALSSWRAAGIQRVEIASSLPATAGIEALRRVADETGLKSIVVRPGAWDHRRYVDRLARARGTAVVIEQDTWQHLLFREAPAAVIRLLHRCPVLVPTPAPLPLPAATAAQVDLVSRDWAAVARAVADDFARENSTRPGPPLVFHGHWEPRVPVTDFPRRLTTI